MATRMQQRRGTALQWTSTDNGNGPVLQAGEIGFETDTGKFKIGDGNNHWIDLDYFLDESEINSITGDYVLSSTLGQNNGVATLDGSGKLTSSQIPTSLATTTYVDTAVSNLIDAAPGALDTLNELAAAINDDSSFASTITTSISGKISASSTDTLTNKTISGSSNTLSNIGNSSLTNSSITINGSAVSLGGSVTIDALPSQTSQSGKYLTTDGSVASWAVIDLSSKQDVVAGVSSTEIGYLANVTSDIQSQLNDKLASADLAEAARDAIGSALTSGTGITITPNDGADTITVSVTSNTYDAYGAAAQALSDAEDYADGLAVNYDPAGSASTVAGNLSSHESDTTTHGVTGNIVGTSDTQTLSNKTLTSPTINGATIGGDLVPASDGTYDLGSSTNKFKDLYLSGSTLYLDAATVEINSGNIVLSHSGNSTTIPIGGGAHTAATQSYVDSAISNLVDSAPSTLNTLNELAAALNDDANYATTITNALATKAEYPTQTGNSGKYLTTNGTAVSWATVDALPAQTSNSGKYLKTDGTTATWETISFPYVPIPTTSVSSNITLESNKRYFVNTSAARTLTLPASPTDGDEIQVFDVTGSAATNAIVLNSNSNKINGTVQNLEIDVNYDVVAIVYTGSGYGWVVI